MTQDGRMQGLDDEASADGPLQMRLAVWEGHPERAKGTSQPDQGRRRCWIGRSHRREAEFRCTVLRWDV
jgi:hypothetical protein